MKTKEIRCSNIVKTKKSDRDVQCSAFIGEIREAQNEILIKCRKCGQTYIIREVDGKKKVFRQIKDDILIKNVKVNHGSKSLSHTS